MSDLVKIIFVVNEANFFLSHRLRLAQEARARNAEVLIVCGKGTGEEKFADYGLRVRTISMSRSGFRPFKELSTFQALRRLYRQEQPDLVHHVTIKPVIYGTPAARMAGVKAVVNAVPGMGFVFTGQGLLARLRRMSVNLLYRLAMSHPNMRVIFQNNEDLEGFVSHTLLPRTSASLIRGSGVDLSRFVATPEPAEPITFLLIGRMLRHKGVYEYVEAASIVAKQHPDWRFLLVGDVDPGNPASLSREELNTWHQAGQIEWLGHRDDVAALIANCHVICLPSYREGLPKTLLEASACARPMISSDAAGCREVVREGVNGLIVPVRDHVSLAQAMQKLGHDADLRERFGRAARAKAEAVFSIEEVVIHTFRVYEELLA